MDISLNQDDVKALEQTRQRLAQLTSGLTSLQQHILQSDPLPPWFVHARSSRQAIVLTLKICS